MANLCAVPLCLALRKRDSWLCAAHDAAVLKGDYSFTAVATPTAPPVHKYHAVRTAVDGHNFDSKAEAQYYADLKLQVKAGLVRDLELQPVFPLVIISESGEAITVGEARMDFRFFDVAQNRTRVIDVKGKDLPLSRLKRKIVMARYGIDVEIVA